MEHVETTKSPMVGTVSITKPPVFKGVQKVKGMKERMVDILAQVALRGERGLNMNELKDIFSHYTQSHLYRPLNKLVKEGKLFRVQQKSGRGGLIQYTTVEPYVSELESKEKNRVATIINAKVEIKSDPVKDSHTLIRETVGYDVISKVDIEDMPAVMRFLKVLLETNKVSRDD